MTYRQTFVIEYSDPSYAPSVGAGLVLLGGKLVAAQFSDALEEIEVLRECCRSVDLSYADEILSQRREDEKAKAL